MKSRIVGCLAFLIVVGALTAQQQIQRGKIAKVDLDSLTVTLKQGDKEIIAVATEQTQFFESKGTSVKASLQAFKAGANVMFVVREKDGKNQLVGLRLLDSSKLVPIDELGVKEYKDGFKGGFYPDGKNVRPKEHEENGLRLGKEVQPRDAKGKPDPQGKIVILSVGMSNTSQASAGFSKVLASAKDVSPRVQFVNGAMGGMTAARIQDPYTADGVKYWGNIDQMLQKAGATREQVQVIWIKQADGGPKSGFPAYAKTLEGELVNIVHILPKRFPNVKLAYLSSRTYGGYAITGLNPEPYAYESAFSVQWLIARQIKGEAALNHDPKKGEAKAPWLSWGPYLWANGSKKRADGFSYEQSDFTPNDLTHLTPAGQEKVGRLLHDFFRNDSTTKTWFRSP